MFVFYEHKTMAAAREENEFGQAKDNKSLFIRPHKKRMRKKINRIPQNKRWKTNIYKESKRKKEG